MNPFSGYRLYHIVIPAGIAVHQIREGNILKIFRNELVQPPPHGQRAAFRRAAFRRAGTGAGTGIQTGHGSHGILCNAQNAFHGKITIVLRNGFIGIAVFQYISSEVLLRAFLCFPAFIIADSG